MKTKHSNSKTKNLRMVLALVRKHPGITVNALGEKMRTPSRTVHDYVRELETEEKIETVRVWRNKHLALPGQMPEEHLSEEYLVEDQEVDEFEETGQELLTYEVPGTKIIEDRTIKNVEEYEESSSLSPRAAMFRVLEIKEEQRKLLSRAGILDEYMSLDDEARELVKKMPTS